MTRNFCIVLGMLAFIAGCIGGEPEPLPPEMAAGAGGQAPAPAAVEAQPVPAPGGPVAAPPVAPPQQPIATERAQPGVGLKGSRYGGGIVTEPVSNYFKAGQAVIFNMQIPSGMKTFKAMNDRYPRDWDEFDREILKPAHIQLPELPPGKQYYYDPQQGQLMVQTVQ